MKYRKKEWLVELAEIAILVVALMLLATGLGRASAQDDMETNVFAQRQIDGDAL